ncbi:PadR family transcriptional regulator [Kineosporia sp. R_H_3]|uniref:PadR family transcriptional regulator n=1 Tax=Kineosporia sp. R_H_3 TaxID=1961848 RepID=UPI000B4BF702|nr:PadR family transcriptional regulator [Kineosporia sp. R_H_3]
MSTADVVLALLSRGPAHGYDLKRGHDTWFDQGRPLAFGQVYATLARLERDGLAAVAHTETGGGPERTVYEITPAGRARLAAWVAEPAEPAAPGADELIRKTVAALRLGLDPAGFVARQRAAHLRRMRVLEQTPATDPTSRLVVEHAVAHLDADLRWLEAAAGYVAADPAADGIPRAVAHDRPGDRPGDSSDDLSHDSSDDLSHDRSRA